MKTFTLRAVLIAGFSAGLLYSCSKLQGVSPTKTSTTITTSGSPTNSNTATAVCDYDYDETQLTNNGWTKTFDDEFTGNLSNWTVFTGGVTNELECNEPANVQILNGALQISAVQQTVTGPTTVGSSTNSSFSWTSGSIVCNSSISANATTPKVMIVARVKVVSGYGLTSLFNSYGTSWPTNGQINYFQVSGDYPNEYATDYFWGNTPGANQVQNAFYFDPTNADLSTCWHVFMTEWTKTSLDYYLDGQLVETKTAGGDVPNLFGTVQNLALSLPIGGLYYQNLVAANVQAGTFYIDYVKVFTNTSAN